MASDNGKPGTVDMYDVFMQLDYLETHYDGTVQLALERQIARSGTVMLCHATFVGNEPVAPRGAGLVLELLPTPSALRILPQRLQALLFELHDVVDDLPRGAIRIGVAES